MPSDEQFKQVLDQATDALKALWAMNPEDFARDGELGTTLSFRPVVGPIRRIIELFKSLEGKDLADLPYNQLGAISSNARTVTEILQRVRGFSPKSGNPVGERQGLMDQIRNAYDASFQAVTPVSAFFSLRDDALNSLRTKLQEGLSALGETRKSAEESSKQLTQMVKAAREASGTVGVSAHAKSFESQANAHRGSARNWLIGGAIFAIGAAYWAWHAFSGIPLPSKDTPALAEYLHFGIPRVIVLSLLFYAVFWSAKNYVSHSHNEVVNRHRQNALQTFETFVQATGDASTKDAVLVRATEAVFMPQATGYLPSEVEPPIPSAMVQILREAADKK